jgi:Lhr-like helicase
MWQRIIEIIKKTALIFTNTRANVKFGFNTFRKISRICWRNAMHHGSIARETQFGLKTPLKRRTKVVVLYIKFGWALILRQ